MLGRSAIKLADQIKENVRGVPGALLTERDLKENQKTR